MKPKLSGFTLVRNGIEFDYPFRESIRSILPIVDELVVNVGFGTDSTLQEIKKLQSEALGQKIRVIESDWMLDDPQKRKSGLILSEQTNIALKNCEGDWCLYLQADEVIHQNDHRAILEAVAQFDHDPGCQGLLFDYLHFYGSYDVIQQTRSAYRREVRVVRKSAQAKSVGDAQSFRTVDGKKLWVKRIDARIYHYGWVRHPDAMKSKTSFMDSLYHGAEALSGDQPASGDNYRYKRFWGLQPFRGTHPEVMTERIRQKGWHWDLKNSPRVWSKSDIKKVVLDTVERFTGIRLFEYRSYKQQK